MDNKLKRYKPILCPACDKLVGQRELKENEVEPKEDEYGDCCSDCGGE